MLPICSKSGCNRATSGCPYSDTRLFPNTGNQWLCSNQPVDVLGEIQWLFSRIQWLYSDKVVALCPNTIVVFGQSGCTLGEKQVLSRAKWLHFARIQPGCNRANPLVVFNDKHCCTRAQVVAVAQTWFYFAGLQPLVFEYNRWLPYGQPVVTRNTGKVVVFGYNHWLYSGTSGCIWAKVVVLRAKW